MAYHKTAALVGLLRTRDNPILFSRLVVNAIVVINTLYVGVIKF